MGGDKSGLNKQIGDLQVSLALKRDHIDEAESADAEAKQQLEELEEMIREDEIILEEMNNMYEVLSDDSYYSE